MEYDQDAHDRPTKPIRVPATWTEPAADKPAERPMDLPVDAADATGEDRQGPTVAWQEEPPARPIPRPPAGEASSSPPVARTAGYQSAPPQWRDTVAPPPPLPKATGAETGARRAPCALWVLVVLSLLISLASLALNGVLVYRLVVVRDKVVGGLDASIAALDNFGGKGFQYEYELKRTIPFSGYPLNGDELSFEGIFHQHHGGGADDAGLLVRSGEGADQHQRPHQILLPIRLDETFHIETQVPIDLKIPIDVQPDDPQFRSYRSDPRLVG
jgi:hypothetical protein